MQSISSIHENPIVRTIQDKWIKKTEGKRSHSIKCYNGIKDCRNRISSVLKETKKRIRPKVRHNTGNHPPPQYHWTIARAREEQILQCRLAFSASFRRLFSRISPIAREVCETLSFELSNTCYACRHVLYRQTRHPRSRVRTIKGCVSSYLLLFFGWMKVSCAVRIPERTFYVVRLPIRMILWYKSAQAEWMLLIEGQQYD